MSALTQKFGQKARNLATGTFLSVSTAFTPVNAVATAALGFLANTFTATQAEAKDALGTFTQIKVNNASLAKWLSTNGKPDIIHNHVENYFKPSNVKWSQRSNLEKAIRSVPLDSVPGFSGYTLGQFMLDYDSHPNYRGTCNDAQGSREGKYIPWPTDPKVLHLSFLTNYRGTVKGVSDQNYHEFNPDSFEPQIAKCDPNVYKM